MHNEMIEIVSFIKKSALKTVNSNRITSRSREIFPWGEQQGWSAWFNVNLPPFPISLIFKWVFPRLLRAPCWWELGSNSVQLFIEDQGYGKYVVYLCWRWTILDHSLPPLMHTLLMARQNKLLNRQIVRCLYSSVAGMLCITSQKIERRT